MPSTAFRSDCSQCFALCCVLLPYSADAGFGADKKGGAPCINLAGDDRCRIHADLRETGWAGCTIFECFGAGQQVSQVTYSGHSWREPEINRGEMAAVFSAMRVVHEMLFHLETALAHRPDDASTLTAQRRLMGIRDASPEEILALDLDELVDEVGDALRTVSADIRGSEGETRRDLVGRDLRHSNLVDANLRGTLLIAADLRGVDLGQADLLGADLRDARLEGADLSRTLFLSQPQVNAARGDAGTRLPSGLRSPWVTSTP